MRFTSRRETITLKRGQKVPIFFETYEDYQFDLDQTYFRMQIGYNSDGFVMTRQSGVGTHGQPEEELDTYDIFASKIELMDEFRRIKERAEGIRTSPEFSL